ncbi:MAG: DUF6141 family protein [Flavobacteriaceae bacterium]
MRVFNERQWFNQWWLQLLNLGLLGLLGYMLYSWYIVEKPTGNVASDDHVAQWIVIPIMVLSILIMYIFKLSTSIDEKGIRYRFFPFHRSFRTVPWSDMQSCSVRTYSPITEYGGWGLKGISKKNRAVNVKGNQGIQIVLKNGDKLLIGTQRSKEAQQVIDRYFKTTYQS